MARPGPPSQVQIEGKNETDDLSTHKRTQVLIEADIRPNADNPGQVRLVVHWSTTRDFSGGWPTGAREVSDWGGERKAKVTLRGLAQDTHYYLRLYTEQRNLDQLSEYNASNFWTERRPNAPELVTPANNATVNKGNSVTVTWNHRDADKNPKDAQGSAQVRWRVAANSVEAAGPWTRATVNGDTEEFTIPASSLKSNTFYDWEVRTHDQDGHSTLWSDWSSRVLFVIGTDRPPRLISPIEGAGVPVDVPVTFEWAFRDPQNGNTQSRANLRYRAVGSGDAGWTTLFGEEAPGLPGDDTSWTIPEWTLVPGIHYEWQIQTYDSTGAGPSDWSERGDFWSIRTPGWMGVEDDLSSILVPQGALGSGTYRVMVYDRGGQRVKGEITPLAAFQWGRARDDISAATMRVNGYSHDCCGLLGDLRCWAHEVVIFRDGVRVWEGPITRLAYHADGVEIEARDPLVYVYRRIMRQGYNDNYRKPKQGFVGKRSVVERAALLIQNALAPNDPNVLPWLTTINYPDDAQEARSVPAFSKTAWEEVDDLAATAGLDYTCVGRRIILHDTHRPVGNLAEMREKDFFSSPVITEYGMSAANVFGVTNNAGLYGVYAFPQDKWYDLGPIEMLASAYGEANGAGADPRALTPQEREERRRDLRRQASRNIHGRWPAPTIVRVPDNSRLHPNAEVGINQLIPGVHVPVRVQNECRNVAQMQKLDSITVVVEEGEERVQVVMSPAPDPIEDPDAGGGDEEVSA
jgi:hypothetical protein